MAEVTIATKYADGRTREEEHIIEGGKMKVKIYQAKLVIEGREKALNKSIAKQFPVRPVDARMVSAGQAKEPICKVWGELLGRIGWLYLVEDEVAGLAWEPPVLYGEDYGAKMREAGNHVDDLASVPTVIL